MQPSRQAMQGDQVRVLPNTDQNQYPTVPAFVAEVPPSQPCVAASVNRPTGFYSLPPIFYGPSAPAPLPSQATAESSQKPNEPWPRPPYSPYPIFYVDPMGSSAALNNQVPPGNRANNYWDNFRR